MRKNSSENVPTLGSKISHKQIKEMINYNPDTGDFTVKYSYNKRVKAGHKLGSIRNDGYITISVAGARELGHRLAFYLMKGYMPKIIDHIDRDRTNNKWENLRDATWEINSQNSPVRKNNKLGIKGVSLRGDGKKYVSSISRGSKDNCQVTHLGSFDTAQKAHKAYLMAGGTV